MHKQIVKFLLIMVFVFFEPVVYNGIVKMFTISGEFVNIIKRGISPLKIL